MPETSTGPLCTRESIATELGQAGLRPGETVLLHSSLSSLGWVCGGAAAVVLALLDALGDDGTLVVRHGRVGAAVTRLFSLADAVAYAEVWLAARRRPVEPT